MAAKQFFNTEEGFKALKEELDYLKNVRRQEVKQDLALARSFGDLSENSEYDEAKNEQAKVESRITELEYIIEHTTVMDEAELDSSKVGMGSIVKVQDVTKGKEITYSIVGSNEVNALEHKISDVSPVGAALMSKHKGDEVEVETANGTRILKILDVTRR